MTISSVVHAVNALKHLVPDYQRRLILIGASIPFVMLVVSLAFIVIHADNSLYQVRHALSFKQQDSWYPMLEALLWFNAHPGGDIYQAVFFQDHTKFQYPLTSLLFLSWMSPASPGALWWLNAINFIFFFSSAFAMGLLTRTLLRGSGIAAVAASRDTGQLVLILVAVATLCFDPVLRALALGQIQVVLDLYFFLRALRISAAGGSRQAY